MRSLYEIFSTGRPTREVLLDLGVEIARMQAKSVEDVMRVYEEADAIRASWPPWIEEDE